IRLSTPVPAVPKPPAAPAAPEKVAQAKRPAAPTFKRRRPDFQERLLETLAKETVEVDLESEKGTSAALLLTANRKDARTQPVLPLLAQRADLKGLPVREGADCQLGVNDARAMQELSRSIRRHASRETRTNQGEVIRDDRELLRSLDGPWRGEADVRTLTQM